MYIGHMVQGKYGSVSYKTKQSKPRPKEFWYRVENTHEPIIDIELWSQVQAKIKGRAKPFGNEKVGVFAKKVKCLYCGYALRTCKIRNERYARCETRFYSKEACEGSMISLKRLEKIVLSELQALNEKYLDKDFLEQALDFNNVIEEKIKKLDEDIVSFQREHETFSKATRDLYLDKAKRVISEDDFIALSKDIHHERNRVALCIYEAKEKIAELKAEMQRGTNSRQIIEQYTGTDTLTREIIEEMIVCIKVGRRYEKSIERPINIYWNF
jgi:hypothetical protein